MKRIVNFKRLVTTMATSALLLIHGFIAYGQQPTHYPPSGNEPVSPTLINILIFIGIPILFYLLYRYFKKSGNR